MAWPIASVLFAMCFDGLGSVLQGSYMFGGKAVETSMPFHVTEYSRNGSLAKLPGCLVLDLLGKL